VVQPLSIPDDPHIDLDELSTHLKLPHTSFSWFVDGLITRVGELISWIWLLLLGVIIINVIMRYIFGEGRIEFEEIQWHLYSIGFLLGLSYAFCEDAHVRVDVLREKMNSKLQAWIELYGILLLLLPFILIIVFYSIPFIAYSFTTDEISEAPSGLPYRWVIKSFLLVGFLLLALTAVSRLSRITAYLFGHPSQIESTDLES